MKDIIIDESMKELYEESCILSQKIRENELEKKELEKDKKVLQYIKCLQRDEELATKANAFANKFNKSTNKKR